MIETPSGFVDLAFLERIAICMESGMSEREAMRVASTDYQRGLIDTMKKANPNLGAYPRNSYAPSLPLVKDAK